MTAGDEPVGNAGRPVDSAASSTDHRRRAACALWEAVDNSRRHRATGADLRRRAGSSPIHSALLPLPSLSTTQRGEGSDVRFRCERDVLAEALGVAGRAATTRNDPLLSNLRLQLQGDQLSVTGTDDELTIHVEVTVAGDTDGVLVAPARLTTDIVRSLEPGAVDVVAEADEAHISSGRSQFTVRTRAPEDFPRVAVPDHRRRAPARARCSATRCARWSAPPAARRTGRCSPACCCRPRRRACGWSPPTRTGWRCATCRARRCSRPASRCSCRRAPSASSSGSCSRRAR